MAIASLPDLMGALRESGLLSDKQLNQLVGSIDKRAAVSTDVASVLLQRGWLSPYQVKLVFEGKGRELALGQYLLIELLGEGGMGQVYKARHRYMDRIVAVKVIRRDRLAGPQAVDRFRQEVKAAAQLTHPNIVHAYDANQVGDTHFFVMEYVEGTDLGKLLKDRGRLPVSEACEYIRQAALGLQHAHEKGMVHRDIKPSNLLVSWVDGPDGPGAGRGGKKSRQAVVKILDMGLARLLQAGDESSVAVPLTQDGAVMGTPDYISPEQATDSHKVDIRADLYSLGCTLFHLLTGQPPFPGGTLMEKLVSHKFTPPRLVHQLQPEVSPELSAVVHKLLAKEPGDRYRTPADLAAALKPFGRPEADDRTFESSEQTMSLAPEAGLKSAGKTMGPGAIRPLTMTAAEAAAILASIGLAPSSLTPVEQPSGQQKRETVAALSGTDLSFKPVTGAWKSSTPDLPPGAPRRKPVGLALVLLAGAALAGAALAALVLPGLFKKDSTGQVALNDGGTGTSGKPADPGAVVTDKSPNDTGRATLPTEKENPPETRREPSTKETRPKEKPPTVKESPTKREPPTKRETVVLPKPVIRTGVICRVEGDYPVEKAILAGNGLRVLVSGGNNTCRVYNFEKPDTEAQSHDTLLYDYAVPVANPPRLVSLALSPTGKQVLFGSEDYTTVAGQLGQKMPVIGLWAKIPGPFRVFFSPSRADSFSALAFAPSGERALAGSTNNNVLLWNLSVPDEAPRRYFLSRASDWRVECVAFSPDGRHALAGSGDRALYYWELEQKSGEKVYHALKGHEGSVLCAAFGPAKSELAVSGAADNSVLLWDLANRTEKMSFKGHTGAVLCVAFSPDGKQVLSGSADKTVRLWDVETGQELWHGEHAAPVLSVSFFQNGRYVLSASKDNTVRRWDPAEK